ncbi:MAG TPA: helix-turn-helix transcriptional regulator [Acidimicrobiales bacterium]|nr:helix-turn-helix transcriptional regulator [Acidimicrobiales bacterium]
MTSSPAVPSPTLSTVVTAQIRAEMARVRVTGAELARRLGVPASWVQRRTAGVSAISLDEVEILCTGLGLDALELITRAYHVEAERGGRTSTRRHSERLAVELTR